MEWLKIAIAVFHTLSLIFAALAVCLLCGCAEIQAFDPTGDIPVIDISVPFPATFPI